MRFFANDVYVIFSALCIEFQDFLTVPIIQISLDTNWAPPWFQECLHESDTNHTQAHDDNLFPLRCLHVVFLQSIFLFDIPTCRFTANHHPWSGGCPQPLTVMV